MLFDELDPIMIVIARDDVDKGDIEPYLPMLKSWTASVAAIRDHFERMDIAFHGYEDDTREVFEIPEVREFVYRLDNEFPFWLFFLSKHCLGLQAITLCFLPPLLTDESKETIFPQHLDSLLNNRWWPAMNHICKEASFTDNEIDELSERVIRYLTTGPFLDQ